MADLRAACSADLRLAKPVLRPDLTYVLVEDKFHIDGAVVRGFYGKHPDGEDPTESIEIKAEADPKQLEQLRALLVAILSPAMPETVK
jgi:hypothetical protein